MELLSREEFKKQVFARDKQLCVVCKNPGVDAHHIVDRSLFIDSGFYLDNGATLCSECHLKAEETTISCEELREKTGIHTIVLPEDLSGDVDKWSNTILSNGRRLKGKLFFNDNVQKILKQGGVLDMFDDYVKYPRTFHAPWSENLQNDDRRILSLDGFYNDGEPVEVVQTIKCDGENLSMYHDYIHVRSVSPLTPHPSRTRVKQIWDRVKRDIPENFRICGENMQGKHSLFYDNLEDYFLVFNIWEGDKCFSWDDTLNICEMLGLKTVPFIWRGLYNTETIKHNWNEEIAYNQEGYVVRVSRSFTLNEFDKVVTKFVRKNHVQTSKFWMNEPMVENKLKDGKYGVE